MKTYKTKRLFIKDFSSVQNSDTSIYSLDKNTPKICYNTKSKSGKLVSSLGLEHLSLPASVSNTTEYARGAFSSIYPIKLWKYKYYSTANNKNMYFLVAFCSNGKLYYNNMFFPDLTYHELSSKVFTQTPSALCFRDDNGADIIGFVSPSDDMLVWYGDAQPYTEDSVPHLTSMSLHNYRLYAIDETGKFIKYSAFTNYLDWTSSTIAGAGTIALNDYKDGLNRIMSFKDDLYVFSHHGISKISSYAGGTYIANSNIYGTAEKIYANTACVCGTRIYFLTSGGLYFFNGNDTYKADLTIDDMLSSHDQSKAVTAYFGGKLYIACHLPYSDETNAEKAMVNNCLVEVNIITHKCSVIRGVNINSMITIGDLTLDKLVISQENSPYLWQLTKDGKLDGTSLKKYWRSGKIIVGNYDKDKILKKIYVTSSGEVDVTFFAEGESKSFSFEGNTKTNRRVVNMVGREFEMEISSTDKDFEFEKIELLFAEEE